MTAVKDDYLTPEALELIARAKALAPKLAERALAADREGRVSDETVADIEDRKSTRLNSSHIQKSRMPSSA